MLEHSDAPDTVAGSMERDATSLSIDRVVSEADLENIFDGTDFVAVVNEQRRVLGLASKEDLRAAIESGGGPASPKGVLLLGVPLLRASDSAERAVEHLMASRVDVLPVVDEDKRLIGTISARQLQLRAPSSATSDDTRTVERCLEALKKDAEAGLVPGDVARWCSHVSDRIGELAVRWPRRQRDRHEMLDCIRDLDPALNARADQLEAIEIGLRLRFVGLCSALVQGCSGSSQPRTAVVSKLRSELLHWIADVRAHDGDLTTWYNEALLRDRGTVD